MEYKKNTKPRSKEFLDNLVNEYLTTGITKAELSKKYATDAVYQLKKLGIKTKPATEVDKKGIQLNYMFETPKNEMEAYIVGLYYADGFVTGNQIGLRLKISDIDTLKILRDYFSTEIKLQIDKKGSNASFMVSSIKAVNNASKIGLIKRKTGTPLYIPNMDKSLVRHFIRGYFDGDGTVFPCKLNGKYDHVKAYICCVTTEILEDFQKEFEENFINSKINKENRKGREMRVPQGGTAICSFDMYRLFIRDKDSLKRLYDYLYSDATIFLKRKKEVFEKYAYLLEYKRKPRAN